MQTRPPPETRHCGPNAIRTPQENRPRGGRRILRRQRPLGQEELTGKEQAQAQRAPRGDRRGRRQPEAGRQAPEAQHQSSGGGRARPSGAGKRGRRRRARKTMNWPTVCLEGHPLKGGPISHPRCVWPARGRGPTPWQPAGASPAPPPLAASAACTAHDCVPSTLPRGAQQRREDPHQYYALPRVEA